MHLGAPQGRAAGERQREVHAPVRVGQGHLELESIPTQEQRPVDAGEMYGLLGSRSDEEPADGRPGSARGRPELPPEPWGVEELQLALAAGMLSLGLLIPSHMSVSRASSPTMTATVTGSKKAFADPVGDDVPLLLRAARGEKVERPPVWMMRQAGRHMQVYRDLVKTYPTFRQRSEIADVATEISLQPWRAYGTDGVILFSDILTPLPGMGIDFDILEKEGPKMPPLRTKEQIDAQAASIDKLYEGMQMLESKILEAKSKKEQLAARARTAKSTQQVNDMLGGFTGTTSMDAFERMEEKVSALEAAAEVSAEMSTNKALPGSAESDIEKQFKMLEAGSSVDDELAKMKGLLQGSSDADSSSSSSSSSRSGVDDELEKLKKDAGL